MIEKTLFEQEKIRAGERGSRNVEEGREDWTNSREVTRAILVLRLSSIDLSS
jgi:hypothetical protein